MTGSRPAPVDLRSRLLEMLAIGGRRKLSILKAWAVHAGQAEQDFLNMVAWMRAARLVRQFNHRRGGLCLELTPAGRAWLLPARPAFIDIPAELKAMWVAAGLVNHPKKKKEVHG